jgi:hypothetical protein
MPVDSVSLLYNRLKYRGRPVKSRAQVTGPKSGLSLGYERPFAFPLLYYNTNVSSSSILHRCGARLLLSLPYSLKQSFPSRVPIEGSCGLWPNKS